MTEELSLTQAMTLLQEQRKIWFLRRCQGITQIEVAKKAHMSLTTYREIEKGRLMILKLPLDQIIIIFELLGLDLLEFQKSRLIKFTSERAKKYGYAFLNQKFQRKETK